MQASTLAVSMRLAGRDSPCPARDVVAGHGLADRVAQEALVHIALGGLRGELHHHARRGVCVHVGVLAGDIVGLGLDDGFEDFVALGLAGDIPLVAVADILLGHLLAGAVHEVVLHHVLNFFHGHLLFVQFGDGFGDLSGQYNVFTAFRYVHRFEDGRYNFLVIKVDTTPVAFEYTFYHKASIFRFKVRPDCGCKDKVK